MAFLRLARPFRPSLTRHFVLFRVPPVSRRPYTRYLIYGAATVAVASYLPNQIYLDSPHHGEVETVCM
jgi:hypothetical protein